MTAVFVCAIAILGQASKSATPATAAERVTLKDGTVVLGQIGTSDNRNTLVIIVRRAWANEALPEKSREWHERERPWLKRARGERLQRLETWRRERLAGGRGGDDALVGQLAAEIEHLQGLADDDELPPLMMVALDRRSIAKLDRHGETAGRWLRLGWIAGLPDVETMSATDLKAGLEARNVLTRGDDPAPINALLPMPIENERDWRLRRAATEVQNDKDVWFALYSGALIPEAGGAAGLNVSAMLPSLMQSLTGDAPANPLPAKLKALGEQGRVGVVVTALEFAPDLSGVSVESTLWVRAGDDAGSWQPAVRHAARVRGDEVERGAAVNVENDPTVKGIFDLAGSLGLGDIGPDVKQRALAIGAATQQATARAKAQMNESVSKLALEFGGAR